MNTRQLGILLSVLFIVNPSIARAEDQGLDRVMNMVMTEMKNSTGFQQSMVCLGVTEKQKNDYLKQYEKDYRSCLSQYPQSQDGGKPFIECLTPKMVELNKTLNIDESLMEKCG